MRKIPTRYEYKGEISVAIGLQKLGNNLLTKLEHNLSFQKLPTGRDEKIFFGNVRIICEVNYGVTKVSIEVKKKGGGKKEGRSCFCFPHFSFAIITAVTPENPTDEFLLNGRFKYDVIICAGSSYLFYENAYDANFGRYYKNQFVLVTIGAEMEEWDNPLDCDRLCLVQKPRFDILMISPVHIKNNMRKWVLNG